MAFTWSISTNNSGGTINAGTGAYTAGAKPNVKDTVKVADAGGASATVDVLVGAGVTITPAGAFVPPFGTQTFGARGGSGTGYTWSFAANLSNGSVKDGVYVAGPNGDLTDVIIAADSLGNVGIANVTVTPSLAVAPVTASVPTKGTTSFTATGGTTPYAFALVANASGGNISSTGGAYTAGDKGSVVDVIRVTDANGATATATVNIGPVIAISPADPKTAPKGRVSFTATGGNGSGYLWSIAVDGSSGATIDPALGAYVAGALSRTTDVVKVNDPVGNATGVSVSVGGGLGFTPFEPKVPPRGTIAFKGYGGAGTYAWSIATNASGATIDAVTGAYTAGPKPNVTDVVHLADQVGNTESIEIPIGVGVSVSPNAASVSPNAKLAFTVAGGSGAGYVWAIPTNLSGATIGQDGAYVAGATENVSDVVSVTDSLGNSASATVNVGAVDRVLPPVEVPPADGVCGCRVVGAPRAGAGAVLAALAVLAAIVRRRRAV
jgi:hypothetical protein